MPIETWEDLQSLGLEMEVLHSSRFAYNCRVLETRLHRKFHSMINRLCSRIGAGSYYMSEQALLSLQVHQ